MAASTTVKITNCTLETVTFVDHHDYIGHIKHGTTYPTEIKTGETIEFVYTCKFVPGESSGAVVYQGQNVKGNKFDWMYVWYNTGDSNADTYKAYTEIAKAGHVWDWDEVYNKLMKSDTTYQAEYENSASQAAISKQLHATYQGTMSLGGGSTS